MFGLQTLLLEGLSEPGFYGYLVYKLKKRIGRFFFHHIRKIIIRYRRMGHVFNVMDVTVCMLSFNPIMVDYHASFCKCTPVGTASDSMTALT